ncbi:MAG: MFS transporter [Rhodospirillaceae bacterium]
MTRIAPGGPSSERRIVFLITLAMFINYIDRGNLALAGPLLQKELGLSATQFGFLGSAFYYSYVLAMIPVGWLTERFGPKRVLFVGVGIWSLATLLTGFASGFILILVLRVLLGLGESASFPCSSKILAQVVPVERLGLANGFMSFGYLLGPAVGIFLGGLLMERYGWRPIFYVFGIASLLWLIPWAFVSIVPRAQPAADGVAAPSFGQILRQRGLWGAALGLLSANYGFYFVIFWLPTYLVNQRGISIFDMALMGLAAYAINAVCALAMGALADRWIRAGRSADLVYKGSMAALHIGGIGCMFAMAYLDLFGLTIALFVFNVLLGIASPGYYAVAQIIAGPEAAGRWVGVQNAIGNTAGFIALPLTGYLVDTSGGYTSAFAVAAAVFAAGFICWVWVLPPIAPVKWQTQKA